MLQLLDTRDPAALGPTPGGLPAADAATRRAAGLVCDACEQLITDVRHRIQVQDAHEHRFMNPGGFLYHIGCFAEAVGCVTVGPDSAEYPWFPGFDWSCAHCGGCGRQLGWRFRDAGGHVFYGLVLDRLRLRETDPDGATG